MQGKQYWERYLTLCLLTIVACLLSYCLLWVQLFIIVSEQHSEKRTIINDKTNLDYHLVTYVLKSCHTKPYFVIFWIFNVRIASWCWPESTWYRPLMLHFQSINLSRVKRTLCLSVNGSMRKYSLLTVVAERNAAAPPSFIVSLVWLFHSFGRSVWNQQIWQKSKTRTQVLFCLFARSFVS